MAESQEAHGLARFFPILQWGPAYKKSWLRADLVAGVTVAAFSIPENMAYASLAGVDPQIGIYASMLALIAYALMGTSRQLSVGVTSALSIMVAGTLSTMAFDNPGEYLAAAQFVAIVAGGIAVVAGLFKLGFVVNFISESVLTGFSAGAALFIASSQIAKLFGIEGVDGNFFTRIWNVISNLGETNGWTLALGLICLAALLGLEERFPKIPAALLVVVAAITVMWASNLEDRGVAITGDIPQGLPSFSIPSVDSALIPALTSLAFGCFLLSYIEGIGAARAFSLRHKYPLDANQELLANGASNISSGLFQGYMVGGSMSRSAVNDAAGARTPAAGLFAVVLLALVLLVLTAPFAYLPETTLAAIVLVAVRSLINIPAIQHLWRVSQTDFLAAALTGLGVLTLGMLEGIIIGVLFSFLALLKRASMPKTSTLGYLEEAGRFVDASSFPDAETFPGVLVFRADAGLFYANAPVVKDQLELEIKSLPTPPKLVVFDMATTPMIDLNSADVLREIGEDLHGRGIDFKLVGAYGQVRTLIQKYGDEDILIEADQTRPVRDIVEEWLASQQDARSDDAASSSDSASSDGDSPAPSKSSPSDA